MSNQTDGNKHGEPPNDAMTYGTPPVDDPGNTYDVEAQNGDRKEHNYSRDIRHGFIRKVYGILLAQLVITTALTFVFVMIESTRAYLRRDGVWVFIVAGVGLLIVSIPLICFEKVARRYPHNYILLAFFTLFETMFVTCVASRADSYAVAQSALCTVVVVLGLTLFSFQSKYDFTSCQGILFVLCMIFLSFGILFLFKPLPWVQVVFSMIGVLIFSLYIVVDTQLILGRGKLKISEDDYIIAALSLYLDIVNIFISILNLMNLWD